MTPPTTRREAITALAVTAAIGTMPAVGFAKNVDRSAWNAAMAFRQRLSADADHAHERWNAARATYESITGREPYEEPFDSAAGRLSGFTQLNHNIDDWGDRVADADEKLLQMPAPDCDALLWKLDYLFFSEAEGGGSTACWSGDFIAQTMADARRLLSAGEGRVMASHAPDFGRASALPLSAVLGAIPSYPRPMIERLIARLIDHLDRQDGDLDLEPNGDELDGTNAEDEVLHDFGLSGIHSVGCPISDPGEDGADTEMETWSHPDDHPAELFIGVRPGS